MQTLPSEPSYEDQAQAFKAVATMGEAMRIGGIGLHEETIPLLEKTILEAEQVLRMNRIFGREAKMDRLALAARGYIIKAYLEEIAIDPRKAEMINEKMVNIGQTDAYIQEIMDALVEFDKNDGGFSQESRTDPIFVKVGTQYFAATTGERANEHLLTQPYHLATRAEVNPKIPREFYWSANRVRNYDAWRKKGICILEKNFEQSPDFSAFFPGAKIEWNQQSLIKS